MTTVYVDMCADLFHFGHVIFLKNAKTLGTKLLVGIHSDKTIESYKRKPIMNMDERILVVSACKYVDDVISDAPIVITEDYIKKHSIDIVAHAHSLEEDDKYNFMYNIPHKLGIFNRLEYTKTISTTQIIERLKMI